MTHCSEHRRIQDYLDDLLPPAERDTFARHLDGCAACRTEVGAFRRLFAGLERIPLERPSAMLADRVLAVVVPSRVRRRRWIARLSVGYAAALAACLAGAAVWLSQPAARALVETLTGEASRRIVSTMMFAINVMGALVLGLADGWGIVAYASERLAPLSRALTTLITHTPVEIALALSSITVLALIAWLRARDERSDGRMPHVGLLGF